MLAVATLLVLSLGGVSMAYHVTSTPLASAHARHPHPRAWTASARDLCAQNPLRPQILLRSSRTQPCVHMSSDLQKDLMRAYGATGMPIGSGGGSQEHPLRRSLRQAYEPSLQPALARAPSSDKIQKLLHRARKEATCEACANSGKVPCPVCAGKGQLPQGGYHKYNPLPAQIIGSKWTRVGRQASRQQGEEESADSKRLLVTVLRLGVKEKRVYAQVAAVSSKGTGEGVTAWVPLAALRNRARWRSGWLSNAEAQAAGEARPCPSGCADGWAVCKSCGGRACGPLDLEYLP
mmetsp:Transcript_7310/g.21456  ORF Transcript_7310/g.21456 Transcript_7310/m.21456 type:complete len:292 (-) Transcript_7310:430-1305(-)